ncbi:hypothetical protein QYE76_066771 [Lolium multiflorum]|uniref:Retrotransposon gag domain-containing protein n=1 Tax=Lolium multiflorum TaxID=4521 RepID=A0AAD8SB70_LOLMU|nr:hypothetical protein QYE76_066771 [Lolium multiflorum]
MTPQEKAEMRAYFAELEALEATMTLQDKAECKSYFKHLESKSDTPHESSCSDIDDAIAMEMRDSTICEMSDSTICEMSDSTICEMSESTIHELECLHLEDMSDTPSSMDDETSITEKKMYMVHEDDAITPCLFEDEHGGHMEPTSSTTPTSYERDYKGTYMGVDDAMIPLVDMMICECMHDLDDTIAMSYASFIPPCDALLDNIVDHVGTTLSTSAALDSPSVIDKLVSPPHASRAGTSAESENSHNIDNVSAVLDDSGSLGSFLDATIAKSRQIENTETPNVATPVNSPESVEYSSDDLDEDYVELNDDFIEKCNATTDARKIKKLLAEHAVRYKLSPDPKFATSPISIRDKDYDFSLDLSHIAIVEKTPFCGTEKESAVEHMTELSTLSGLFSDDIKMRTYFVAKIFPFSLKDDAKTWYNNLSPGSIKSPKELLDVFFRKYFPASAQHAALQRIYNFDQEDGEKLPEAWARFCSLIRAQPDHDLEKNDLLDIFYSGLTIESRAYLDSCAGCVFRKRTPEDAEELLAKIGRNHDDWSTPEPTPTPIVKKRGMIKLNDEDMREAKKSLKEKGIKPEDVKNLPPIEDICETIPPSSMIEDFKFNWSRSDPMVQYKIYNKAVNLPFGVFCAAIGVPQWGSCEKIRGTPRELSDLYTRICNGRSLSNDDGLLTSDGTFKRGCHLPPIHVHEELSSRTTLFQVGGDDAARPSVFTASCASSPRRHAKVNLLLYACLESPTWNDILLHTPSYLDDRNSTTSTEGREDGTETRGRKADVTEAWKRRRKRSWKLQGRHCRPTQAGTAARAGTAALPTPALPPWS